MRPRPATPLCHNPGTPFAWLGASLGAAPHTAARCWSGAGPQCPLAVGHVVDCPIILGAVRALSGSACHAHGLGASKVGVASPFVVFGFGLSASWGWRFAVPPRGGQFVEIGATPPSSASCGVGCRPTLGQNGPLSPIVLWAQPTIKPLHVHSNGGVGTTARFWKGGAKFCRDWGPPPVHYSRPLSQQLQKRSHATAKMVPRGLQSRSLKRGRNAHPDPVSR